MKFFILKTPAFLDFSQEKYSKNSSLKNKHQVLFDGKNSNSKLVKFRNGQWCVKYGNSLLPLRDVECKPMKVAIVENKEGEILETVSCKWFLQSNRINQGN